VSAIPQPAESAFLTVSQAAAFLNVSTSWVRRHVRELASVRVGHLVRFDATLLHRQFQSRRDTGNRLKAERFIPLRFRRYQEGSLVKQGKVWYGVFREDVPQLVGPALRKQKKVRLGKVSEVSRDKADELLRTAMNAKPCANTKVRELVTRCEQVRKPTIRYSTALYYQKMLDTHVLPYFGDAIVSNIEKFDVERFLAEKAAKGYRENTLRGMRVSLSVVLSWAIENRWIPENPCADVALPKTGTKVVRTVLKPADILAISAGLKEP
jgi:excisionase family DNA binding protein